MVTCNLIGRLGNNMFQIAAAIGMALKNDTNYLVPPCPTRIKDNHLSRDTTPFDYADFINRLPRFEDYKTVAHVYHEKPEDMFHYVDIPFVQDMCLHGFFQTEKYFEHCRDEVLQAFDIAWRPMNGIASIHVRRTDYVNIQAHHPVVSMEYLRDAINLMKENGIFNFHVFSDDIPWCRENLTSVNFPGAYIDFSEGRDSIADLTMMACCEHNIIAGSTFSWWGAWLNRNPDKIVVCPKDWLGPAYLPLVARDIYPEGWIKL